MLGFINRRNYLFFLICYSIVWVVYLYRYELSYWIKDIYPLEIMKRDLTFEESLRLDETQNIRSTVTMVMLVASIALSFFSYLILYYEVFKSRFWIKLIFFLSLLWCLILLLVKVINFVPISPIR